MRQKWTQGRKKAARQLYEEGHSLQHIATKLGSNTGRVSLAIQSVGCAIRPLRLPLPLVAELASLYLSLNSVREICGHYNLGCKKVRTELMHYGVVFRGRGCNPLDKNGRWKGGKTIDKSGYLLVKNRAHPNSNNAGYIREHRLVMEKKVGRYLKRNEVVHHINGQRDDNRPENLELFQSNGLHLKHELSGKCPKWTTAGLKRINEAHKRRRSSNLR